MDRIELSEVTKTYDGSAVLSNVPVIFERGQNIAIIGRSGGGKSTLLRLVAGLERPTSGEIRLDGRIVSTPEQVVVPPHERHLSMVFQDLALWPNLSVLDNVLLGLHRLHLPKRQARDRARNVLALCGIEALSGRKPGFLSGGEQQRVALARAVVAQPKFLLLDEPFSGLDLVTKHRLLEETSTLSEEKGVTVVLVTHEPLDALELCSWGIVLEDGRVNDAGDLDKLVHGSDTEILRLFREWKRG